MLNLTLYQHHSLYLPDTSVSVVEIDRGKGRVTIGINAPADVPVLRGEVLARGFDADACRHASEEAFEEMAAMQRQMLFKYPSLRS